MSCCHPLFFDSFCVYCFIESTNGKEIDLDDFATLHHLLTQLYIDIDQNLIHFQELGVAKSILADLGPLCCCFLGLPQHFGIIEEIASICIETITHLQAEDARTVWIKSLVESLSGVDSALVCKHSLFRLLLRHTPFWFTSEELLVQVLCSSNDIQECNLIWEIIYSLLVQDYLHPSQLWGAPDMFQTGLAQLDYFCAKSVFVLLKKIDVSLPNPFWDVIRDERFDALLLRDPEELVSQVFLLLGDFLAVSEEFIVKMVEEFSRCPEETWQAMERLIVSRTFPSKLVPSLLAQIEQTKEFGYRQAIFEAFVRGEVLLADLETGQLILSSVRRLHEVSSLKLVLGYHHNDLFCLEMTLEFLAQEPPLNVVCEILHTKINVSVLFLVVEIITSLLHKGVVDELMVEMVCFVLTFHSLVACNDEEIEQLKQLAIQIQQSGWLSQILKSEFTSDGLALRKRLFEAELAFIDFPTLNLSLDDFNFALGASIPQHLVG